jgi:tetratricopeptide (TPR) repeat protein
MYALRAKVDLLSNHNDQSIKDLETAIAIDPSTPNEVFNTGGVRPEDDSNPSALQKKDLDLLISRYPDDYRPYMFRGLFYNSFTTYDENYYGLALSDLKQANRLNPISALVEYFLGSVYQKGAYWTKAAWADTSESGGYRDKANSTALEHFQQAIKLDSKFARAYAQVAESLFSLKQYREAIPYYDKVIEFTPDNAGAYNDRGLSKTSTNDTYGAISDFSKAIDLQKSKSAALSLGNTYENRAVAYVAVMDYDRAVDDYSMAIGLKFASQVFLMSIPQIRGVYPEFKDISDHDLLEGLRKKYFPNMSSEDFVGQYQKNNKPFEDFVLAGLYGDRGDTYLKAGDFKKAAGEYARARSTWSKYSSDRWKVISKTADTEYSVDTQTLGFRQGNTVSLWVKIMNTKNNTYSQQEYQLDCSGRKIKSISVTSYNSVGNVMHTSPGQEWETVVPESMGEVLYNGVCR